MQDEVRERLATLGQLLIDVEGQRRHIMGQLKAVLREFANEVSLAEASTLTALPEVELQALVSDLGQADQQRPL